MIEPSEKIREILNFSGYPFQHYCVDLIGKLDKFQVSAEIPYTHPPTNGPLLGVHGSIDAIAACPDIQGEKLVIFVVECKKANDRIKNWILLPNKQQRPKWPTFTSSEVPADNQEALGATRSAIFPRLGYSAWTRMVDRNTYAPSRSPLSRVFKFDRPLFITKVLLDMT